MPSLEIDMVSSGTSGAADTAGVSTAAAAAAGAAPGAACTISGPAAGRGWFFGAYQNQAMSPAVQRVTAIQAVRSMSEMAG